ncbi:MAG: RNA polymerase subunit sigma [Deltaproteobacteria bacterium]|nr:RNA polymerase subunit sigma [Deltaproteobacteria bacterium]
MTFKLEETAKKCAEMIEGAGRIAMLSGAGMSTAAGIPDFRGPNGFYSVVKIPNPERIFEISTFREDPSLFYKHGRGLFDKIRDVEPTLGHKFFAALENKGKMAGIVTQNIDALHQRAGSRNVLEIHGGIWDTYCTGCNKLFDYDTATAKIIAEEVPHCEECGGVLKPDVVFFGEAVKRLEDCQALARSADLFFVVGSSLIVTPAALLPMMTSAPIVVVHKGEISSAYLPRRRVELFADEYIDAFFSAVDNYLKLL